MSVMVMMKMMVMMMVMVIMVIFASKFVVRIRTIMHEKELCDVKSTRSF